MTTEYSRNVDWQEEYENWQNIGQDVMREFYEANPKEAKKEGYDLDEDGEVKYLDELLDHWQPMMNYAYPLVCDPTRDTDKILKVCQETCLTVMYNEDEDTYYLALCGGGMDLSQSIAYAYQILENWIPLSLLREVSKQPELSLYGEAWLGMALQIKRQLGMDISQLQQDLKHWDASIAEYKEKKRVRKVKCQS